MQRAVQASLVTAKSDQIKNDADMARAMTAEFADLPADVQPRVVADGGIEKSL